MKVIKAVENKDGDVLLVAFPEVLGDTYDELVINLGKNAVSGKMLAIAGPSKRLVKKVEKTTI